MFRLLVHQINLVKFDSAWGVSILDSEWQRTIRIHSCVRLGFILTNPILIKMNSVGVLRN